MPFIIYGKKTYALHQTPLLIACEKCKYPEQSAIITKNFFSLYLIQLIPLRKKLTVFCPHCLRETSRKRFLKELSMHGKEWISVQETLKQIVHATKTPIKYYLPLLLILFALCVIFGLDSIRTEKVKRFQENPQENSLLLIKSKDRRISLLYISEINNDKVIVHPLLHSFDKTSSIPIANLKEQIRSGNMGEFNEKLVLTKGELKELNVIKLINLR